MPQSERQFTGLIHLSKSNYQRCIGWLKILLDRKMERELSCFVHVLCSGSAQAGQYAHGLKLAFQDGVIIGGYWIQVESGVAESWTYLKDRIESLFKQQADVLQIVISDELICEGSLHKTVVDLQTRHGRFCLGLLAVISNGKNREIGIDAAIVGQPRAEELRQFVIQVLRALLYRQRPIQRQYEGRYEFRPLSTLDEMRASFALRYEVFSLLNYIPEEFNSRETRLELDNFDKYSISFGCFVAGKSLRLAGVVRLITQRFQQGYAQLTWEIVQETRDLVLRHSYESPYFQELPVFESLPLEDLQHDLVIQGTSYCELSRVIVREDFRGQGLSSRLVRYALAQARREGIQICFLACVPEQVEMYAKLGFRLINRDIAMFRRVDQPAKAMYTDLSALPNER